MLSQIVSCYIVDCLVFCFSASGKPCLPLHALKCTMGSGWATVKVFNVKKGCYIVPEYLMECRNMYLSLGHTGRSFHQFSVKADESKK